jgi:hypothetical protein
MTELNQEVNLSRDKLRKRLALTLTASVPLTLTGCVDALYQDPTAYEECLYEMESAGIQVDCDDEDSDWYKKKGYKSKSAVSSYMKSRSGYGGSYYSSGG